MKRLAIGFGHLVDFENRDGGDLNKTEKILFIKQNKRISCI